jgi:hypothetical protein
LHFGCPDARKIKAIFFWTVDRLPLDPKIPSKASEFRLFQGKLATIEKMPWLMQRGLPQNTPGLQVDCRQSRDSSVTAIPFRELYVAVQPALSNRRQDEQIPQIAAENTVLQAF